MSRLEGWARHPLIGYGGCGSGAPGVLTVPDTRDTGTRPRRHRDQRSNSGQAGTNRPAATFDGDRMLVCPRD